MGIPHFLCIPFPTQGHVNPLMQFSEVLAKHGCKVTFVNTEFNHKRTNGDGAGHENIERSQIKLVTLPDGLEPADDRGDRVKLHLSIKSTMPHRLPKLIEDVNVLDGNNKVTCIIVTNNMGWALQVGHKLGIKGALLCPSSAISLASLVCIPTLIHDGIIDSQGNFLPNIDHFKLYS
ncbi:hypothetical protein VNO77_21334 [Canavalia gladiata]|uniref:Glycosyltransferase N-terminal domain-containing protein n=1 Tax=Canavalia gladiata TaxID=3824 RepID=A0AAN9QK68_CANGL